MLACVWPVYGRDLPADLVKGALSISGLHDLEPMMHTPFLQPSLKLTKQQVRQASPALLPAPAQGRLFAVAGGDESEEFQRQARLIREALGERRCAVSESRPGLNHSSVLEARAHPGQRLNELALKL